MKSSLAILFLYALSSIFSLSFASSLSSCEQDVNQMRREISMYGSITTANGDRFTAVSNPTKKPNYTCSAAGYNFNQYMCTIIWTQGEWGNTFHCE